MNTQKNKEFHFLSFHYLLHICSCVKVWFVRAFECSTFHRPLKGPARLAANPKPVWDYQPWKLISLQILVEWEKFNRGLFKVTINYPKPNAWKQNTNKKGLFFVTGFFSWDHWQDEKWNYDKIGVNSFICSNLEVHYEERR